VTLDGAYYQTISECPLTAWEQSFKKGYSAIRKNLEGFEYSDKLDYDAWDNLYIDWQNNVTQDKAFELYQKNISRLNDLYTKFIQSQKENKVGNFTVIVRDRSIINQIRRIEAEVKNYEKNLGKGQTINQTVLMLSRIEGRHINKRDLTVQDYFDLIELNSKKPSENG